MNACSSGGQYQFPYGNIQVNKDCQGQIAANETGNTTVPVGSLTSCQSPVAAYAGVFDLSGNAAEWDDSCDKAATGTSAGPSDQCHARGGSIGSSSGDLACNASLALRRDATTPQVGFRCCGAAASDAGH
jgi:formylglycine-generating enzyme required for sulfatase activity